MSAEDGIKRWLGRVRPVVPEEVLEFRVAAGGEGVPERRARLLTPAHAADHPVDERRGLTASVERDDRTWTVSLLDIEITADQHRVVRLVAAYRRWLGIDQ